MIEKVMMWAITGLLGMLGALVGYIFNEKFKDHDRRFEEITRRMDSIERKNASLEIDLLHAIADLKTEVRERLAAIEAKLDKG